MGGGLCVNRMVGVKGLEPSTSRSQTARASQLRHTPVYLQLPYYTKATCPCLVQNLQTALGVPSPQLYHKPGCIANIVVDKFIQLRWAVSAFAPIFIQLAHQPTRQELLAKVALIDLLIQHRFIDTL